MDLINAINPSGKDYDIFLQDLLSVDNDLPSNIDEINSLHNTIISHVNSKLNQTSTRRNGFNILTHVLPKCSNDLLSKYAVLWITKASQTLETSQSDNEEITLACKVLATLIVKCKELPELHKNISMQVIKQLVSTISNLDPEKRTGAVLYLVATMLYHYKEPCERLQTLIRKIILPLIDADRENLVQAGANCYALLARVTERSFKPPAEKPTYTGWVYAQALLCNNLHSIMDDLFTGLIELENNENWEKLDLPNIAEDNIIEYYRFLERRFKNLSIYLSTVLRGCSGKNSVCPKDIIQLLCRGLAVTPSSLRHEDSFKKRMLEFVLPKLHISLFTILNAFIEGFKNQLLPFAVVILQLYQQTLKWTEKVGESKTTISGGKAFKSLRIAVYDSLKIWLSCLGTLSGIDVVVEDFLPYLSKDITPEKERVLLTVQKTQHLSKRALKRYKENQYENSTSLGSAAVAKKNPCINAELCKAALEALENIFLNPSRLLKPSFYKATQTIVVPLLYDYYLGKREENYYDSDNTCRLYILRVLKAIVLNPHPSTPPPIQYAVELFAMALKDTDRRIVREAKVATAELEKIVHPSAPTLQLNSRDTEESGGRELGIRWSRPAKEQENVSSNGVGGVENDIWERFRETRNDNSRMEQSEETTARSLEIGESERTSAANGVSGTTDGPTPSKQLKLGYNDPGELMDTSEDEIITSPRKDDVTVTNENVNSSLQGSPRKRVICKPIDGSSKNDESSRSEDNEEEFKDDKAEREIDSTNDNEIATDEECTSNGDIVPDREAKNSVRLVDLSLEDNSNDEAILALFCDEVKDP